MLSEESKWNPIWIFDKKQENCLLSGDKQSSRRIRKTKIAKFISILDILTFVVDTPVGVNTFIVQRNDKTEKEQQNVWDFLQIGFYVKETDPLHFKQNTWFHWNHHENRELRYWHDSEVSMNHSVCFQQYSPHLPRILACSQSIELINKQKEWDKLFSLNSEKIIHWYKQNLTQRTVS